VRSPFIVLASPRKVHSSFAANRSEIQFTVQGRDVVLWSCYRCFTHVNCWHFVKRTSPKKRGNAMRTGNRYVSSAQSSDSSKEANASHRFQCRFHFICTACGPGSTLGKHDRSAARNSAEGPVHVNFAYDVLTASFSGGTMGSHDKSATTNSVEGLSPVQA
jgi:hypothetical protein